MTSTKTLTKQREEANPSITYTRDEGWGNLGLRNMDFFLKLKD